MSDTFKVRLRRPDGREVIVDIPNEHLQRVLDLAHGEFGDKSIVEIFPPTAEEKRA